MFKDSEITTTTFRIAILVPTAAALIAVGVYAVRQEIKEHKSRTLILVPDTNPFDK